MPVLIGPSSWASGNGHFAGSIIAGAPGLTARYAARACEMTSHILCRLFLAFLAMSSQIIRALIRIGIGIGCVVYHSPMDLASPECIKFCINVRIIKPHILCSLSHGWLLIGVASRILFRGSFAFRTECLRAARKLAAPKITFFMPVNVP